VALRATLTTCNVAALWLSAVMHRERVLGKHDAQKRFYTELKQRFGLAAQPAIRVIAKVADAYTTLRANIDAGNYGPPGSPKRKKATATPIRFRVDAAQPFDARCLSWQIPETVGAREATVSIWTTQGPAYTSQTCSACRWVDKRNRRTQSVFECVRCRFVGHADHNAALNIAARGVERWGEVMRPHAAPTLAASQGGSSKPMGRLRTQGTSGPSGMSS
jgi:hypothetical protein